MGAWTGIRVKRSWSVRQRLEFLSVPDESGCRLWKSSTDGKLGYGKITINNVSHYAHRISWEDANGIEVPDGLVVMHTCDNPACIEPSHLSVGTQKDNVADQIAKRRYVRGWGSTHALSKLTEEQAQEIRRRFDAGGITKAALAREFGLSATGVWRVITGRSYNHETITKGSK